MGGTLLDIRGLSKRFGGVLALDHVDLAVRDRQIKGLVGPNGAGKSTLFNVVTNVFPADSGEVLFAGRRITRLAPHELVQRGMVRTFQKVHPFRGMTALESVMVGRHVRARADLVAAMARPPWVAAEERGIFRAAFAALDFVGLRERAAELAETLPLGLQRLLQLASALAAEPQLLLLDEPASGLTTAETRRLAGLLGEIRRRGMTIVLVEHDMSLVMTVSDEVAVLNFGRKIAEGGPDDIRRNPDVIQAYLGGGTTVAGG